MAIINLAPDTLLESTGFASGGLVDVQDSPSSPNANWMVTTTNGSSVARFGFPTPTQPSILTTTANSQTFTVRVKASNANATASAQIQLYKNGVLVSSGTDTVVTNTTGINLTYTWTPTADDDGSLIECRVVTTGDTSGGGSARGHIDIGAVQWQATTEPPATPAPSLDPSMSIPTELFPFNNSAWRRVEVSAYITDPQYQTVKLEVEYAKDAGFATKWTQQSGLVVSGNKVTITLNLTTFADGNIVYWKARTIDSANNASNWTSAFNFTYKPNSTSFAPDGTPFMQQGDPNVHIKFVDISQYQGAVDFVGMKNAGINYMYLRTYGASRTDNNNFGDTNFESYVSSCRSQGIKSGGYFFAMPSVPVDLAQARLEADRFIAKLESGYGAGQYGDLIPMLDLEDNTGSAVAGQGILNLSVEDMLQWANEFRNHFEAQTGRTLGLYTGDYFVRDLRNNFNHNDATNQPVVGTIGNILKDMPLWIQGYTKYDRYKGYVMTSCGGWTKWQAFQYSEDGAVANIAPIDENLAEPMEWLSPPKTPTGLSATDNGTDISVTWSPSTEEDVNNWDIYVNDVKVGSTTTDGSYTIVAPSNNATHTIEVRPVDDFGDDPIVPATISYTLGTPPTGGGGDNGFAPVVTIVSVSRTKVSDESEVDRADIRFHFDQDTKSFTVNVNGVDYSTGIVADSGGGKDVGELSVITVGDLSTQTVQQISIIVAGMEIVATVDWTELYGQGENRVNIYGESLSGLWTPYNDDGIRIPQDTTPPENVTNLNYTNLGFTNVTLNWTHSVATDLQNYTIYQDNVVIGTTANNTYDVINLTSGTSYNFKVVSNDVNGLSSTGISIDVLTPSAVSGQTLYLAPDEIISVKGWETMPLSYIQDEPMEYFFDSTSWVRSADNTVATGSHDVTLGFPNPSGVLVGGVGLQKLQVSFAKNHGYSNTFTMRVMEGATQIANLTYSPAMDELGMLELPFDADLLTDKSGANLRAYISSTEYKFGTTLSTYWTTDILAVQFVLQT